MNIDEAWLLANGISRETLDKALGEGGVRKPNALDLFGFDVTFEPVIQQGTTLWIPINGWVPATLNAMKSVKLKINLKKRDRAILCEAVRQAGLPKATGRRRLSLEIRVPAGQKRWDPDAFWKSVQDACVHAGLLVNDSPVWFQMGQVRYDPVRGPLKTTLVVEDIA